MIEALHVLVAWALVLSNAVAGAWCLVAWKKPTAESVYLEYSIGLAHGLFFIQGILGVILYNRLQQQASDFHLFYGFFSMAFVGFLYAYRYQLRESKLYYPSYSFGCLFLAGMALRTIYLPAIAI